MNPIIKSFKTSCIFKNAILIFILLINPGIISESISQANIKDAEIKVSGSPAKNANKIVYGLASFYHQKFEGRQTATGEIFRHSGMTAACNVLPLGTWVQVTNLKNGKIIIVRTNDRLHPKTRRIIDLTYEGAKKLGYIKSGLTRVKIEILDQKKYKKITKR